MSAMPATYMYDGSFDGWLSAVFEAARRHDTPGAITSGPALALGPTVQVETDSTRADRVRAGLDARVPDASTRFYAAFLSETPGVEAILFRTAHDVLQRGPAALADWRSDDARAVHRLAARTWREVHRMHAFVRFEKYADERYVATVRPGPHVLPLLTTHFAARFPILRWVIVDAGRGLALVHTPAPERSPEQPATQIVAASTLGSVPADAREAVVQAMWHTYFRAVDIPERENLAQQRRHVPKRYWADMTELRTTGPGAV